MSFDFDLFNVFKPYQQLPWNPVAVNINLPQHSLFHFISTDILQQQIKTTGRFGLRLMTNDDTLHCSEILFGFFNFIHYLKRLLLTPWELDACGCHLVKHSYYIKYTADSIFVKNKTTNKLVVLCIKCDMKACFMSKANLFLKGQQ